MASPFKHPKLTTQQVGADGEHFVADEIHRRGDYAVTFSGNMRAIDLLASDAAPRPGDQEPGEDEDGRHLTGQHQTGPARLRRTE